MSNYVSVKHIHAKVRNAAKSRQRSKLFFIRNSAEELRKIWKVMPKKRYHKRYYTSHRQRWINQGIWEAVFICNVEYERQRDENGRGTLYVTDLVWEGDYFKKVHVRIDYGDKDLGNTIESFRVIPLTEEGLLKELADRKVFKDFWDSMAALRKNPHAKREDPEEKRIIELLEELL